MTDRVLVVEDDPAVRTALERALGYEGYDVAVAGDGAAALQAMIAFSPDAVVLDLMMPFVDGLEACRRIRAKGDTTPILILTARGEVADRVEGLDAGADDYMVKPFALEELLARLRALLRRSFGDVSEVIAAHGVSMDLATREATRDGEPMSLTKMEFDLLALLVRNAGIVVGRDRIFDEIWGIDFTTTSNSLDVYVGYLRRKTEEGDRPRLIQTVRGVGYVFRPTP
jgi:two-component system response regulator MprA